jgi:hypothetical protein
MSRNTKLRALEKDRRNSNRSRTIRKNDVLTGWISDFHILELEIINYLFGQVIIRVKDRLPDNLNLLITCEVQFLVTSKENILISGPWKVKAIRNAESYTYITMEVTNLIDIRPFESYISHEVLLRPNRFKVLNTTQPVDMNEVSQHLTELVDFPINIPCTN